MSVRFEFLLIRYLWACAAQGYYRWAMRDLRSRSLVASAEYRRAYWCHYAAAVKASLLSARLKRR